MTLKAGSLFVCLTCFLLASGLFARETSGIKNESAAKIIDGTLLLEAESFTHRGGWTIDQQYFDVMGSPVLIAHGLGIPVEDAVTNVEFATPGVYRVFVRTRNWVAPWMGEQAGSEAPGRFQVLFDGKPLEATFGTVRSAWHWQEGGSVQIDRSGRHEIRLRDMTGFDGRCDAILFTNNADFEPPEDHVAFEPMRRRLLGLTDDPLDAPPAEAGPFDLVVCGGGIAGITTAVSAARLGLNVALIQNRPILGGNNSSEIRVPLRGRVNFPIYPNLGNMMYELDPRGSRNMRFDAVSDAVKLDLVKKEKNISLYLSTHVFALEKSGDQIRAVIGRNIETNEELRFEGTLFADCTGDGNIGYLAGASWRMGRESKRDTGEQLAPEKADNMVMGASAQWRTVEVFDKEKKPLATTFPDLPWAIRFNEKSIRPDIIGDWDWELGYQMDQIMDIERIRDLGLRAAFGHWSYMKNHSDAEWREKVANRRLGWVICITGKRESRRLLGDVILQEQDIVDQKPYPDACVTTVWHLDLHLPCPENTKHFPGEEFRTKSTNKKIRAYAIPYRCFYSKDVSNLFMAGRNISVTHVALGTVRVMRTIGMMGEVVGMAASVCIEENTTPRGVYTEHFEKLDRLMKKGVAPAPKEQYNDTAPRTESDRGETDLLGWQ